MVHGRCRISQTTGTSIEVRAYILTTASVFIPLDYLSRLTTSATYCKNSDLTLLIHQARTRHKHSPADDFEGSHTLSIPNLGPAFTIIFIFWVLAATFSSSFEIPPNPQISLDSIKVAFFARESVFNRSFSPLAVCFALEIPLVSTLLLWIAQILIHIYKRASLYLWASSGAICVLVFFSVPGCMGRQMDCCEDEARGYGSEGEGS